MNAFLQPRQRGADSDADDEGGSETPEEERMRASIVGRNGHNQHENQVGQDPPYQPCDQVRICLAEKFRRGHGRAFQAGTLVPSGHQAFIGRFQTAL